MKVVFFTKDKEKELDDVVSVDFVGDNGKFRILKDHDKLVSLLPKGDFKCAVNGRKEVVLNVISGLVNVENNIISVFLTEYSGDIA